MRSIFLVVKFRFLIHSILNILIKLKFSSRLELSLDGQWSFIIQFLLEGLVWKKSLLLSNAYNGILIVSSCRYIFVKKRLITDQSLVKIKHE